MGFYFGASDDLTKKKGWKKIWKNVCESLPETSWQELEKMGLRFYDVAGSLWFVPITLESVKLATAYENDDYEEVMEPLRQSLATLQKAMPIFDEILKQLPKDL
jgi:hypothetical protein